MWDFRKKKKKKRETLNWFLKLITRVKSIVIWNFYVMLVKEKKKG